MKKRNIKGVKVVYSKEPPIKPQFDKQNSAELKVPGSTAFVPAVAGLIMAGEVIKDLTREI